VALGLCVACRRSPAPSSGAGEGVPAAVSQRTTRGDIALRNLNDRIQQLEKHGASRSLELPLREQLVEALLTRVQFRGTYADFDRVREIADAAVRDLPNRPEPLQLRARAASAVHRFEDAVRDLQAAAALGADVDARLAAIRIAQGRELESARDFARHRVERQATLATLGLLANAEAALGEFDAADEHYAAALAQLHDVSPFLVAQLTFQRGVMWAEQADRPDRAEPFYVEAVRRLPQYVVANVHLAELEAHSGRRDAAIERLRGITERVERGIAPTLDPEPLGLLGELMAERTPGDPAAAELLGRARAGYERLLEQHRSAFLDHGAEFFSGPGADPTRGLALAQENLTLRPTPRAYALTIEAAFAAHDAGLGCRLLDEAAQASRHSKNLAALIERDEGRCATR
jgi:tetratricopeptide (TPR) repeat protein